MSYIVLLLFLFVFLGRDLLVVVLINRQDFLMLA